MYISHLWNLLEKLNLKEKECRAIDRVVKTLCLFVNNSTCRLAHGGDDLRRDMGPSRFNEYITCTLLRHVGRDWTDICVGQDLTVYVKQTSYSKWDFKARHFFESHMF